MTNPAAPVGLTFDGTDLQESDFSIFLEITSGLFDGLSVRGVDTVIPGAPGRLFRNRVTDRRVIQLVGYVSGTGATLDDQRSSFRDNVQTLAGLFDQVADPAPLVASLEDGSSISIDARTVEIHFGELIASVLQRVEVDLESVVPDWTAGS